MPNISLHRGCLGGGFRERELHGWPRYSAFARGKVWFSKSSLVVNGSAGVAGLLALSEARLARQAKWVGRVVGYITPPDSDFGRCLEKSAENTMQGAPDVLKAMSAFRRHCGNLHMADELRAGGLALTRDFANDGAFAEVAVKTIQVYYGWLIVYEMGDVCPSITWLHMKRHLVC